MPSSSSVVLDGGYGEGGGALVRAALAMSALTQQPVEIRDVRSGTRYPGVDVEDIALIEALLQVTSGESSGATEGSDSFTFKPKKPAKGLVGRAGGGALGTGRRANALILLNTLHTVLMHAQTYSEVIAEGETFGANALSFDAFQNSTCAALARLGAYSQTVLREAAFGRESSGLVSMDVEPSALEGIDWTRRGELVEATAYVSYSNISENIPERAAGYLTTMSKQAKIPLEVQLQNVSATGSGCHITVCGQYENGFGSGSMQGARGVRVETVAAAAFDRFLEFARSGASVDQHLADQILLACVFAREASTFTVANVSRRLLTSVWVIKQFMPVHITISGPEGSPGTVSIKRRD